MPLVAVTTTPRTWWMAISLSANAIAEAAMYSRHARARSTPTSVTATCQAPSKLATHARNVRS